ncbi:MAG TPA: hypothetical protein VI759_09730 [Dehalococcoidia bacterium]|nr:hypothetical protein [Dehalococcoidia bacterium]
MSEQAPVARPLDDFALAAALCAEEAIARLGLREAYFKIAGLTLKTRFAGDALHDQISRPLAHIRSEPVAEPDLTITVWDTALSGIPLPKEAGPAAGHLRRGLALLQQEGRYLSLFEGVDRGLSVYDVENETAVYWVPDATRISEGDRATPFRVILNWWLPSKNCAMVHSAGIGTEAGGVLLFGLSGAGKSTTSLASFEAGFEFLADDLCAITVAEDVTAYSVYCSAKVYEHNLERVPNFASLVTNPQGLETEKAIGFLTQWDEGRVVRAMPIRAAIVLTAKEPGPPKLNRIAPAMALRMFAPPSVLNLPGPTKSLLGILARLCSRVPCYEMQISTELPENPRALRQLLASLETRA